MSAAIVQKNTSVYFECVDIFGAVNKSTDKQLNISNRVNGSSIPGGVHALNIENTANILGQRDKLEQEKENDQYQFHGALTRTSSQPHTQQESHNVSSLVTTLIENIGNMSIHRKLERTQSEPLPQQINTSRYKTELCRPFEEAGECKYGEKCQFAHGYHELRNLQRHPKYKTEYCRTFHSVGFCPYGPRCHFVHNADEARALQQQMQQQQQQSKLQNHSNFNNCISTNCPLPPKQSNNNTTTISHSIALSPPHSMSTGSDRESPTSLSPTNSMTNFPFGDQVSPSNSVFQTAFPFVNTPPDSPNATISPVNTPPPSLVLGTVQNQLQIYVKPVTIPNKQILHKSSSSPIAVVRNVHKTPTKVNSVSSLNSDDTRLPVFNRLSSAVENFPKEAL